MSSSNNACFNRVRAGEEENTERTIPGIMLVRKDDQHIWPDEFKCEEDAVGSLVLSDACTDELSSVKRLGDKVQLKMMNSREDDETGRPVMMNDDEQHKPGEMSVLGDGEDGGEVSDDILLCLMSGRKAGRLGGDDTALAQLRCRSAKFGERQEPRGILDTAPSLPEVKHTAMKVRPGANSREVLRDIFLLDQRQNLGTDFQQPEEYSRSMDSTGSAGTPS